MLYYKWSEWKYYFCLTLINCCVSVGSFIKSEFFNNNDLLFLASLIYLFCSLYSSKNAADYSNKIDELKKYDIYLDIREQLEKIKYDNLFNGVTLKREILNINTLDNYSLNDIQKIKDNMNNLEDDDYSFTKKKIF